MSESNPIPASSKKRSRTDSDAGPQRKKIRYQLESAFTYKSAPISIIVGEERATYFVHESHITLHSEFFKKALEHEWKEKNTRTIDLPDCDAECFSIYLEWLYTGRVCITKEGDRAEQEDDEGLIVDEEWSRWTRCFEIGDFLQDSDFKDAMIDTAIEKMMSERSHCVDIPSDVYVFSLPTSPHRKLAVEIALNTWEDMQFQGITKREYPSEFLTDLITAMGGKIRTGIDEMEVDEFLYSIDTCKYHEHTTTGSPCYRMKRGA